jgi:YidC/Oxa1 family membrane protein insertase
MGILRHQLASERNFLTEMAILRDAIVQHRISFVLKRKNILILLALALSVTTMGMWRWSTSEIPETPMPHPISIVQKQNIVAPITGQRLIVNTKTLQGSIDLKGLRFDDATLKQSGREVRVLAPMGSTQPYSVVWGWDARDVLVPDENSEWQIDPDIQLKDKPVVALYRNAVGQWKTTFTPLESGLFSVKQELLSSNIPASLKPYVEITRGGEPEIGSWMLHQGVIGSVDGKTRKQTWVDAKNKTHYQMTDGEGWLGLTDKYWLVATSVMTRDKPIWNFENKEWHVKWEANTPIISSQSITWENDVFVGDKSLQGLNHIRDTYNIQRFDQALDTGWFPWLVKPLIGCLTYLEKLTGDMGLAIIVLVFLIRMILWPLATKGQKGQASLSQMSPRIKAIREEMKDDPVAANSAILALYKNSGTSPFLGVLMPFIQFPIMFAMFKVLYIAPEMKYASFLWFVPDMSAPDTSNVFSLFGLLPDPSRIIPMLHIGIWAIFVGITIHLQQRTSPPPADKWSKRLVGALPWILVFTMSGSPTGLLVYWTWSNGLASIQQWWTRKVMHKGNVVIEDIAGIPL